MFTINTTNGACRTSIVSEQGQSLIGQASTPTLACRQVELAILGIEPKVPTPKPARTRGVRIRTIWWPKK